MVGACHWALSNTGMIFNKRWCKKYSKTTKYNGMGCPSSGKTHFPKVDLGFFMLSQGTQSVLK